MVMVCKIGESQSIANLFKQLALGIYDKGGVVRKFTNLGDRIPAKFFKTKDRSDNFVIRLLSVNNYFKTLLSG